ncbi:MAG: ABC transporter ATP-binding protein [Clostridia bacterium]|nr:ABC transporter ATP-binding protein [Clostridia bacterium]
MAILEVKNVTKVYNKRGGRSLTALNDVSFSVDEGEVVGFIGPNGAGKSTCIKCITGLATQTSGSVTVCGFDTVKEHVDAIANVGAIIENPDTYLNRTALDNLRYYASISRIEVPSGTERKAYINDLIDDLLRQVGLYDRRNDKVSKYSLGMKQRLGIAQAMIAKPKLLILDEPTNGLDPMGIREMRDVVRTLAHEQGVAVLISSHGLAELQQTCDRFLLIRSGRLIADFSADEVGEGEGTDLVFTVDDVQKAVAVVEQNFEAKAKPIGENRVEVTSEGNSPAAEINEKLVQAGVRVSGLYEKRKSLEDVFVSLTEKGANDVR